MGTQNSPCGVVVLGMHRSGTSAVAGYLAKAGFFAGDDADLLPAAQDNPKGFFERSDVNQLNDRALAELGGNWDNPPPRAVVEKRGPAYTADVTSLLEELGRQADGLPIVLKDPRVSLLLPAWLPALQGRFCLLVVDRPPVEVAQSVRQRDGRPLSVALALWQLYCAELAHGLEGREVSIVRYQDFVSSSSEQGPWLLDQLASRLPAGALDAPSSAAAGFVSSDMRHHRSAVGEPSPGQLLTGAQVALADWLGGLGPGWCTWPDAGDLGTQPAEALTAVAEYYDAVADRHGMETAYDLERHKALHFEQATELKDQHIANLEAELAAARPRLEKLTQTVGRLEEQNRELAEKNAELERELLKLRKDKLAAAGNLLQAARRSVSRPSH